MKWKLLIVLLLLADFGAVAKAQPPKMKMTTPVPEGIATPDRLQTSLGNLTSFDGVPDEATTQKVYDNLDLQRATHAFLSTIQISSMTALEKGLRRFGPPNTTAVLFEELMDSTALWLTPNTVGVVLRQDVETRRSRAH